jgi:hypothetical protein
MRGVEMGVTHKDLGRPDDTMTFDNGKIEIVKIGEVTVRRSTFQPGWRWSVNVGPIAGSATCPVHHVGYIVSGRLHVATNDGADAEFGPGEAYEIQPGHDGWVAGQEPLISVEFSGTVN